MKATPAAWRPGRTYPGSCAWSFDDWRDVFYPHDLPRNRWLEYYARHFPAVEMDSSFYHLPSAATVAHWRELAGPGFLFCPKLPKTLSHDKRLEDPAEELAMAERLAGELGENFGCALLQLPPSFRAGPREERSLRQFLRAWAAGVRLAVEFRHESWETPRAARILSDRGVAWVWADTRPVGEEKHAGFGFLPVTSGHLYLRLLGDPRTKYLPGGGEAHRYGRLLWPRDLALDHWTSKLAQHPAAAPVFIFANNHFEGMAVETTRRLARRLGVDLPADGGVGGQVELFDRPGSA